MERARLVFRPIDLDAHASICIEFRRDSFISSFGVDSFFEEAGAGGVHYIERLRLRTMKFRDGYVHAWLGDTIVGQLEMQILEAPRIGYVNLFYLVDRLRGAGFSGDLQEYAMRFMASHGVATAQLSVSPSNARAVGYYRKHGWEDLGLRPGRDNVHLMQRQVSHDASHES
ncbi:MAG: GNAT family N-acetyltransferase [Deltaproteobacteria bacterium]|nr:GNAT family N-acetyltransferase [Nannocystaceae bacterium]